MGTDTIDRYFLSTMGTDQSTTVNGTYYSIVCILITCVVQQRGQAAVVSDLFRSALIGDGHQDVDGQYEIIDQQHQSMIPVAAKCVQQYPNETIANINVRCVFCTIDCYTL